MKRQILYTNNTGKSFLYGLYFFLIFLLSITYSSILMAQDYNWNNSQNFLNLDWVYNLDGYSWSNNFSMLSAPVFTSDQGRSGFQAQAPEGIQVLSARSKHVLYSFWSRQAQDQLEQNYYPVYLNQYQPSPYPQNPLMPFYDELYWHPTASYSPIGPSMFYGEPYWQGTGASSASIGPSMFYGEPYWYDTAGASSASIGPSMFYGEPYWHGSYGGFSMDLGW